MKTKNKRPKGTCIECGSVLNPPRREDYQMWLAPNWGVTVEDVEFEDCPKCGLGGGTFWRLGPLMIGIAAAVAGKRNRLAAPEITFLRKHIEYTGVRLAKALGVTGQTVSRWESGREPIGPSADRLLRLLVLLHDHQEERFAPDLLEAIEDSAAPLRLRFRQDAKGEWAARAAA